MRYVPLRYAARIVKLLAQENHPEYNRCANRFVVRVADEVAPRMEQLHKLIDVLGHVHHYYWQHEAMRALEDVVGQLHRMAEKSDLDIDFSIEDDLRYRRR